MNPTQVKDFYGYDYFHGGDYYDYLSAEKIIKKNFSRFIHRLLEIRPSGVLLEMGCAYGFFLDLAKRYWDVTGVDVAPDVIAALKKRSSHTVHCGDISLLDLAISHYDWTVGWDMIEHVDEPRRVVRRCFDLLRPGGYLAFTTGDVSSWAARLCGHHWRLLTPPSHLTFFSKEGMRKMLRTEGFDHIKFQTVGYERPLDFMLFRLLGKLRYLNLLTKRPKLASYFKGKGFYMNLGDIMLVVGRKPSQVGI